MRQTQDSLRSVQCPVCREDRSESVFLKNGYSIVACCRCGLRYVNPRPTPEDLDSYYGQEYFKGSGSDAPGAPHLGQQPMKMATAALRLALLRQFRRQNPVPERLLDLGCGGGFLAHAAMGEGWRAIGMDASLDGLRRTAAKEAVSLVAGRAEHAPFRDGQFDIVVAIDVLEHVFCPRTFLIEARRLLAPRGLLLIETPNMDGWMPWLLGSRHPWFRPPEHLTYFTPATIRTLLEQTGFHIERLQSSAQKALTVEYLLSLTVSTNPVVNSLIRTCVAPFSRLRQRAFTVPLDLLIAVATA